ncbi:NUDIX domain-containing protein [Rhizobium sp. SSA_523]|uniref:NUDIX domain-containing protein n=1 Tax=Rhizobium sp. SSA_523 TaxID=2952477 RepID=UPI0020902BC6|nr:NUDIX domain-containing protein [Rhizobium sp. SSA_523]MCO5730733.1 NUDIX domain-containing protein [Rhizobium sp. SSA_523]WKC24443.1 NUDIX domain-containing protein [Rhizobium sp. SSA_523]
MNTAKRRTIAIVDEKLLSDNWYHLHRVTFDYTDSKGRTERMNREVYDRGNGATILLYDPKRDLVVLVRQFRMPAYKNGHDGFLIETPAGLLDGDHPEEAIRREAVEETGYQVRDVRFLFKCFMSPGAVTEIIHFFAATIDTTDRVSEGGGLDEEHEDIEVLEIPLAKALAMIESGEICDGKTIMLLHWAALNRDRLG